MEDKDQIILQLKAELYDVNKHLANANAALNQLAAITASSSLQEMYDKIVSLVACKDSNTTKQS